MGWDFMYRASREFEEKDSVSPAMIQRMTKNHQYQVERRVLRKARLMGECVVLVAGRRVVARERSDGVR